MTPSIEPVVAELADGTPHRGRLRAVSFAGVELGAADGAVVRLAPEAVRHLTAVR